MWFPLLRRARLPFRRERFPTRDGDFVDLDWVDGPATSPLLVILHGLEGSSGSHYVSGLCALAKARAWRAVTINFRSCSGEPNRLPRFYHAGDTDDFDEVLGAVIARESAIRVGAVGISIGGNVLLKWLGERGAEAPKQLLAAVAISVPFDLVASAAALDRGFERLVYTGNFLRTFRTKVRAKALTYPGFVDVEAALRARTFREYDRAVTAPLHGFADERDYWVRASSKPWLERIRRPTLLIAARDDPFVPAESLPDLATLPACVHAEFVVRGGHVGFVDGRWPWRATSWAELRAIGFLSERLLG